MCCARTNVFVYVTHDTTYNRVMKILSNGVPYGLFCNIGHHTKAVYKCTISRYVNSCKYPYRGIYTNIAKTAIASLYVQCYNPISYSGHPRGSQKYRFAKMWCGGGGGVHEGHMWPAAYWYMFLVFTKLQKLKFPETSDC